MREIKFRAWHKQQHKMYSPEEMGQDQLTLMPDGRGFANIHSVDTRLSEIDNWHTMIPLQYTGLKDSEIKEEYFGDIIEENDGTRRVIKDGISVVVYEVVGGKNIKYFWDLISHKVIGNIYENPELLKVG